MKVQATAPGKVILFGEHAVVYGRPAIAVPVTQVRATATVQAGSSPGVLLVAPDLATKTTLSEAAADDPLALTLRQLMAATGVSQLPDMTVTVTSQIPIASGLGSGAAISAAILRAAAEFLGISLLATNEWVSALTYEVEKVHHGTPSGIDNTVVTYEQPVYFVRQQPENRVETFRVAAPLRLLIADTGKRSSTRVVVEDVSRRRQRDPLRMERLFDACGQIAREAREAIERGDIEEIGRLMDANHAVLQEMSVSSVELDRLVDAAIDGGALGAKLSGAGRGGNMIALVTERTEAATREALLAKGAIHVMTSVVSS